MTGPESWGHTEPVRCRFATLSAMRRTWAMSTVAVALLACGCCSSSSAQASEPVWSAWTDPSWVAYEVGAGERSVKVVHTAGCGTRNEHAVVREGANEVTVELLYEEQQGPLICQDDLQFVTLQVPLAQPLAGRRILGAGPAREVPGQPFLTGHVDGPDGMEPLAPRLIGFSLPDARLAAARSDVRPHVRVTYLRERRDRRAVVVWQSPAPGEPMPLNHAVVRLRVAFP
jgi:hypothetical protein